MEAPDYLSKITLIAERYGRADTASLYEQLRTTWVRLEEEAKSLSYDILCEGYANGALVDMVRLLYQTPGADYRQDSVILFDKDRQYKGSWYRRGGQGAFMMLARKWDRIEAAVESFGVQIIESDSRAEGIRDDFGDLRRYLLLVIAWHESKEVPF